MEPGDPPTRLSQAPGALPQTMQSPTVTPAMQSGAPWYRREWRDWPFWLRTVSALGGALVVVAALVVSPSTDRLADDALAPAQAVTSQVEPTVAALQVLWRVVVEPLLPVAAAVVLVMGAACAAIGLAINYLVQGRTSRR
jgi:hypothetical protein